MVGIHQVPGWHTFKQFELHLQRIFANRQPGAVTHPKNMRVHGHGGFAKSAVKNNIGRFSADPRQGLQGVPVTWDFATVFLNQDLAGLHEVARLAAKQADGFDVAFQTFLPQRENLFGRVGHCVELAGGLVHADIGGQGREQDRTQQLKHRAELQLGHGLRIGRLEGRKKRLNRQRVHQIKVLTGREKSQNFARCFAARHGPVTRHLTGLPVDRPG
jgi:hypothetical protein